jgi:hypothetical protein
VRAAPSCSWEVMASLWWALRAFDGAPKLLPEAVDRPPFFYHACHTLTFAERYQEALRRFDEALADARQLGWPRPAVRAG